MFDPIVDEVRQARDRIAAHCGYDLDRLADYLEKSRKREGIPAVRLPASRIEPQEDVKGRMTPCSSGGRHAPSAGPRKRKAG